MRWRLFLRWAALLAAVPLWVIGELGTFGGIQPANQPHTEYVSLHPWFLLAWIGSIVLVNLFFKYRE